MLNAGSLEVGKRGWKGEKRINTQVRCRFRCSVKVMQEKVARLYTRRSSHEEAEHEGWMLPTLLKYATNPLE